MSYVGFREQHIKHVLFGKCQECSVLGIIIGGVCVCDHVSEPFGCECVEFVVGMWGAELKCGLFDDFLSACVESSCVDRDAA